MKLSELVKIAAGTDPEVLIVEDNDHEWTAFPLEERKPYPCFKHGYLVIAASTVKKSIFTGNSPFEP